MNYSFISKPSFWSQSLLTNLTTLLIVYFADESIFREEILVPDLIYALFAFILVVEKMKNGKNGEVRYFYKNCVLIYSYHA